MSDTPTPAVPQPAPSPTAPTPVPQPEPAPDPDPAAQALASENANLRARLQREAVIAAAVSAGVLDTNLIDHLPMSGTSIDKEGRVQGVDAALTRLRADFPKIFGQQPSAAPAPAAAPQVPVAASVAAVPAAPPSPASPPAPTRITPEDWRKNKNELLARARAGLAGK